MNSLLVTGGAGFIGVNFVRYWSTTYPKDKLVVYDALTYAGNIHSVSDLVANKKIEFVKGNICDTALVEETIKNYEINNIVHFAAESHVDRSITGPDEFITTNVVGTHSLLKAAKSVWLECSGSGKANKFHRFHHVSTDEVYGTLLADEPAFTERTQYAPNSPYSASKAASDHLVRAYHHTYGLNVTTSNCSNNYGPYHFPEKLIPLVLINILLNNPLPIYGDGQQIRDWLYVEDHAKGIDLVLKRGKVGENYNIGGHNEWTNIDIVKLICSKMDKIFAQDPAKAEFFPQAKACIEGNSETLITFVKDRPGHDRRYAIDSTKSMRELNYKPDETFETGLSKTISWYLNNSTWWNSILDGSYR